MKKDDLNQWSDFFPGETKVTVVAKELHNFATIEV